MFDNIKYKFQSRNSKKNLLAKTKKLEEQFSELRKGTLGNNSMGWITFDTYAIGGSSHKKKSDDSLQGQINDLRDFLGIDYTDSKLAPKPKAKESK